MTRSMPYFALPHLSDEAVAAFADGVLTGGPRSRAQQHLNECADCAGAIREQRQARLTLRSATAPMVPGSLLARLRELPACTPLGGQPAATAMSDDGYPAFAAYDSKSRPEALVSPLTPATRPPVLTAATPPVPSSAPPVIHRRLVPGLGMSAAAAAAVIVGVLASTAATAGGATSTNVRPGVNSPVSVPGQSGTSRTVPILNLVGR